MLRSLTRRCARRALSTRAAGALYLCGTGESHKLGLGDTDDRETPVLVDALKDVPITHVASGKYHTAALGAGGEVYAWGLEKSGQLGLGSSSTKATTPAKVDSLAGLDIAQLSCGMYHTLALTADGDVYSCGFGGSFFSGAGGLGHGDRAQLDAFTKLQPPSSSDYPDGVRVASVSAGGYHSVALDVHGGVWTWGRGEWGRLGHGDAGDCLRPTRVEDSCVLAVSSAQAGEGHTGVLAPGGTVYTWGRNEHWQLGYEAPGLLNSGQSFDACQEPHAVTLGASADSELTSPVRILSCGEQGSAALLEDGSLYVWGMQRFFEPTLVPGSAEIGSSVVDMQLGATHLALLTESGQVYTFGSGTALCLPRKARTAWELAEITEPSLEGRKVLSMACGPHTTALIVEA